MKISQSEARRLKHRVAELENLLRDQRMNWARDFPGGIHIASETNMTHDTTAAIKTARKLGHAVVAVQQNAIEVAFYALPLPRIE